jgi:predicted DNA-binding transcriptional regulator AlpA
MPKTKEAEEGYPCEALRGKATVAYTGVPRSTRHKLMKRGEFPLPISLTPGGRAKAWLKSELDAYLARRKAERDHEVTA